LKVTNYRRIKAMKVEEGAQGATIRWLITKNDGAENFAMRFFEVEPKGYTPFHSHEWEHEVFILEGRGTVKINNDDKEFKKGDAVFIPGNIKHQMKNTGQKRLKFLCLIPSI
jgi:quercetin dioxygenase-like cupin family protein